MKYLVAITIFAIVLINNSEAKVFSKCEFARAMSNAGFSRASLPNWVCLVKSESNFNSRVKGGPNSNGSYDWGIFQINDKYWCKVGYKGGDCNMNCNQLVDDNISDDIACTKIIYKRHGYNAWYGWKNKCQGSLAAYQVNECF
ncbi:unnamed protein product [Chironomus riparius]|uniref:Glycosyl hydrolases family 22 (GH22) domain-containing protein n=1 Tax=Chironomus riparius TaxID=315576 RepID=A0A9N9WNQ7_9DIPT|nr:unnamed protein product [Chironomus riparius]